MKTLRILTTILALLLPLVAIGTSGNFAAAQAAGGPTISLHGSYPLTGVAAGDYDLTYLVLDFAPGAAIPLHYHGGPALVVGMQGKLTLRHEGSPEHMLMPGDVANEQAGMRHIMINTSASRARAIAVVLLPKGAQLTTIVDTSPNPPSGPTVAFHGDYPLTVAAGDYSLENLLLDFAPGTQIPLHYHGGPVVFVGMEGSLTLRPEGASEHRVGPGDVMNENAGVRHVMINTTNVNGKVLAGVLLPRGAELTTLVAQPPSLPGGMPTTGMGYADGIIALVLVALLLIAAGWLASRVRPESY